MHRFFSVKESRAWCVYMVRCADHSLYTGMSHDHLKRVMVHNQGQGAKYTRARLPVELVYVYFGSSRSEVCRFESILKRYSKAQKERLVADYAQGHIRSPITKSSGV